MTWLYYFDPAMPDAKYLSGLFTYMSQFFFQNHFELFPFLHTTKKVLIHVQPNYDICYLESTLESFGIQLIA